MTGLLVELAGWVGAAALLLAYGLVSHGRLSGRSTAFQLLNLTGAAGLLTNGIWHGAWPSAALNGVWLVIGAAALGRLGRSASGRRGPVDRGVRQLKRRRSRRPDGTRLVRGSPTPSSDG